MKITIQRAEGHIQFCYWEIMWDGRRIHFDLDLDELIGKIAGNKDELHLELTAHEPEKWDMVLEEAFRHERWLLFVPATKPEDEMHEIVKLCTEDMERILGPKVPKKIFIRILE